MSQRLAVVGLGEILWDVFPDGPRFGGAPANFGCSVAELAGDRCEVHIVSGVGDDELGRQAIAALHGHGVETSAVAVTNRPTGQVLVQLDGAGHATYEFATDTAWDHLAWDPRWEPLAASADAVCFGTLGQRSAGSRDTIRRFVKATPPKCLRVLDVNFRPPFWTAETVLASLRLANVLKLNEGELRQLARLLGLSGTENEVLQQLMARYPLRVAALTRGSAGAILLHCSGEYSDLPGQPVNVVDSVGAGDSFTAALVVGLLSGLPLGAINAWAARVAAFVCSQPGATPHFPNELRRPESPVV
jgi:fructokinase